MSAESLGVGRGSAFTVLLPVNADGQMSSNENSVEETDKKLELWDSEGERPNLAGLRVLLVDDEPDTLEVLRVVLSQFGAEVRGAVSTVDALKTFLEWRPDVLVSDLGMPGEDGYALIDRVRSLRPEQGRDTPAAALTAHVRDEDRVLALAKGYQAHINKPVDPTHLAAAVATLGKRPKS